MLLAVNKSCTTHHAVAQGGCACEAVQKKKKQSSTSREKALHFCPLNRPLHARCVSPGAGWPQLANFRLALLIYMLNENDSFSGTGSRGGREREGGGGGERERKEMRESEIEQNLPLARTSFSVAFPTICMQRRDKRDSNVSRRVIQRRVTKRCVAYRPAIRLSRSLGFPTCLCLASWLSSRTSGAQWRRERSDFSPSFSFFELHSLFIESISWASEGPSSLKWKQTVEKKVCGWSTPGHHRDLKESSCLTAKLHQPLSDC